MSLQIKRFITVQLVSFVTGTFLFISLFHTGLFTPVVFFYRGILFLTIVTLVWLGIFLLLKRFPVGHAFTYRDILLAVVLLFCVNLVFFTHFPVTEDRSVSVFLLGYMNNRADKTVTGTELTNELENVYVRGNDALGKRIHEQLQTGTIRRTQGGYTITPRGELLMRILSVIADLFGLGKKNLST